MIIRSRKIPAVCGAVAACVILALLLQRKAPLRQMPEAEPAAAVHKREATRTAGESRRRSPEETRKFIDYLARERITYLDEYGESLSASLKERLKKLCDEAKYEAAIALAREEVPKTSSNLTGTVCARWAEKDKDGCLAWLMNSKLPDDLLEAGVLGIFSQAAQQTDPAGKAWVRDMLDRTHAIPHFDFRMTQLAKAWVPSGVLSADEYVSWWRDWSVKFPGTLPPGDFYSGLGYAANTLLYTSSVPPDAPFSYLRTTGSETRKIQEELFRTLGEASKAAASDPASPPPRQMGSLAGSVGSLAASLDGLSIPLDAQRSPLPDLSYDYYTGVGSSLRIFPSTEIVAYLKNSQNPANVESVWGGYIDSRSLDDRRALLTELGKLDLPDNLTDIAGSRIAGKMLENDSLAASKRISELPQGNLKNAMIRSMVTYLDKSGKNEEADQWRTQLAQ
jgi:hypothetical protein